MMMTRLGLTAAAVLLLTAPSAWAVPDNTAPTVPTNLRVLGAFAGRQVLGWDASTDDTGINHYRVMVNGAQAYRPRVTNVRVDDLVRYDHVLPGHTYTIAIQAVDSAGNRSASSAPLQVTVT
jgi:fibronectin type III domain protein